MSHDILLNFGVATFSVSAAIILVLLVRKTIAKFFGPHFAYAFWLVVPVATIASIIPAEQVFHELPVIAQEVAPVVNVPKSVELMPASEVAPLGKVNPVQSPSFEVAQLLLALWAVGALFAAGTLVYRQRKFLSDSALKRLGSRFYKASKNAVGPAAIGFMKTRIVVPSDFSERYNPMERKLIIDHEREHIRVGDVRINGLVAVLQCLNWFNPLVYMAQRRLREDQELACDARVMRKHAGAKRTYAEALLKAQFAGQPIPVGCAWPAGGGHALKHRIVNLGQRPSSNLRKMLGALVCVFAAGATGHAVRAMIPAEAVYVQKGLDASVTTKVKPLATVNSMIPAEAVSVQKGVDASVTTKVNRLATVKGEDSEDVAEALGAALVDALAEGRRGHARSLIKAGADINFFKRGDGTPLIIAADRGDRKTARMLLDAGADVNKQAAGDGSPLIAAADRGDEDMVKLLVDAGADVNGYVPGDGTPLIAAIEDGDTQTVRLLLDAGADADQSAPGDGSPLIAASAQGELALAQLLVERGANVNGYVPGDETPLINAAAENEIDVARFLIERGADVNLAVEANDRRGRPITRSPLGQAERFGNTQMARLLRDSGAEDVPEEN